ncbi:hypothetical protein GBA63_21820 (plasmid) [Rubrobacter tropicus]|uniref:Uncharacterized protein n=1 Tax=Rubrobacter tropicus TaxID=2653851 RepID=A0A6G8QGL1_9ACTN|nr:hypothetical protein [Rubrobacter tropicus]QIN85357.1 hypothetical protein GBA63_21820 [Rubrobacter tropicus]
MRSAMRALLVLLVVAIAAFSSSDPYLEGLGLCGHGGCPEASHVSHVGSSGACLAAVLVAAAVAGPAFFAALALGRAGRERRPAETFLPPDPPPPRVLLALPSR